MKSLILQRLDTSNYFRRVTVLVDGKKVGKVGFAERVKFEVPDEAKEVRVKIDWCQSHSTELDIKLPEEVFFIECSSSLKNVFIHPDQYLQLHRVRKNDLPSSSQLEDFRRNFKKVASISAFMLMLFGVFFIYTLYVAIFENSPLWYVLTALAGYNIYRISKGIRLRMKGQL